ncbi:UDP-3-O-[3-hydroxymyristoyl] N-acetylglucosamine deacetylase [Candidatus Dependentiae bacterium]|nr:UDP-3-O-[3-hydroxymyristoyl] N-acetylglucosamine deacetylase [Candidatus Dependentiae bacterium]
MNQRTIQKEVSFQGIGVHFGAESLVTLKPASENTGIVFISPRFPMEKIVLGQVIPENAMHASVIRNKEFIVSTVEHLMASISAFSIDNLIIEVQGLEVPILDGSALPFVCAIEQAGILEQNIKKNFLTPKKELNFEEQKNGRFITIKPAEYFEESCSYDKNLYFKYFADFKHPLVQKDNLYGVLDNEYFSGYLASARTFGFLEQLPFLRRHGLAKGTTLGNTVVIGEEEFLNDKRFENEFIRHKLLDLFGDLALLGKNLIGSIVAQKTGHNFNRQVIQHYIENPDMWYLI